jgi:hypothetical protein
MWALSHHKSLNRFGGGTWQSVIKLQNDSVTTKILDVKRMVSAT